MKNAILPFLLLSLAAAPAYAQDAERELGSTNSTELGWVLTGGNAQTNSFNLRNVFEYKWEAADLGWEFGVLRADSGDDRFAVGTEADFELVTPPTEPDNERIYSKVRYLRTVSERLFWYGRLDYERDKPADINYRITPAVGAGNNWIAREELTLRTGYGISYAAEDLTLSGSSSYAGYQVFYELLSAVSTNTRLESNMTLDGSFETTSNYRFNWLNGVGVAINERVALKASLRLVYRNDPAFETVDLQDGSGAVIGSVVVRKKKLDSGFTTSLVINF